MQVTRSFTTSHAPHKAGLNQSAQTSFSGNRLSSVTTALAPLKKAAPLAIPIGGALLGYSLEPELIGALKGATFLSMGALWAMVFGDK